MHGDVHGAPRGETKRTPLSIPRLELPQPHVPSPSLDGESRLPSAAADGLGRAGGANDAPSAASTSVRSSSLQSTPLPSLSARPSAALHSARPRCTLAIAEQAVLASANSELAADCGCGGGRGGEGGGEGAGAGGGEGAVAGGAEGAGAGAGRIEDAESDGTPSPAPDAALARAALRAEVLALLEAACALPHLRVRLPRPVDCLVTELCHAERRWPHALPLSARAPAGRPHQALDGAATCADGPHRSPQANALRCLRHFAGDEATGRSEAAMAALRHLSSSMHHELARIATSRPVTTPRHSASAAPMVADVATTPRGAAEPHVHAEGSHELAVLLRVAAAYVCQVGQLHSTAQLRGALFKPLGEIRRLVVGSAAVAPSASIVPRAPQAADAVQSAGSDAPLRLEVRSFAQQQEEVARLSLGASLLCLTHALVRVSTATATVQGGLDAVAAWAQPWLTATALQWSQHFAQHVLAREGHLSADVGAVYGGAAAAGRVLRRWQADAARHMALCSSLVGPRSWVALAFTSAQGGGAKSAEPSSALAAAANGAQPGGTILAAEQLVHARARGPLQQLGNAAERALVCHLAIRFADRAAVDALPADLASRLVEAAFDRAVALLAEGDTSLRMRQCAVAVAAFETADEKALATERSRVRRELRAVHRLCTSYIRLLLALSRHRRAHAIDATFGRRLVASVLAAELALEVDVALPTLATPSHSVRASEPVGGEGGSDSDESSSCASSPPVSPRGSDGPPASLGNSPAVGGAFPKATLSHPPSSGGRLSGGGGSSAVPRLPLSQSNLTCTPSAVPSGRLEWITPMSSRRARFSDEGLAAGGGAACPPMVELSHSRSTLPVPPLPVPSHAGGASAGTSARTPTVRVASTSNCGDAASKSIEEEPRDGALALAPAAQPQPQQQQQQQQQPLPPPPQQQQPPVPMLRTPAPLPPSLSSNALGTPIRPATGAVAMPPLQLSRGLSAGASTTASGRRSTPLMSPARIGGASTAGVPSLPSVRSALGLSSLSRLSAAAVSERSVGAPSGASCFSADLTPAAYAAERQCRLLYTAPALQLSLLQLLLSLLVSPAADGLERQVIENTSQAASEASRSPRALLPIPLILQAHLAHPANASVVSPLLGAARALGEPHELLLRLLAPPLFDRERYVVGSTIARGAFGSVLSCELRTPLVGAPPLAVKQLEVRKSRFRRSNLCEVYAEALALHALRGDARAAQLHDVGTDGSSYWLVMRRYVCTLKQWADGAPVVAPAGGGTRSADGDGDRPARRPMPALLDAYCQAVEAVAMLHAQGISHYDLKADNFLLQLDDDEGDAVAVPPLAGAASAFAGSAGSTVPSPLRLVVADFGVATVGSETDGGRTPRDRGTERIKSPQMLLVGAGPAPRVPSLSASTTAAADHRAGPSSGPMSGFACDVWSMGCLLFELLTGTHLFGGEDWGSFYQRLTTQSLPLIAPAKAERLPSAYKPAIVAFLEAVLHRDPQLRPTIGTVSALADRLRSTVLTQVAQLSDDTGAGSRPASVPCAPSPRGAFGVAEQAETDEKARHGNAAQTRPAASKSAGAPAITVHCAARTLPVPTDTYARLSTGFSGAVTGIAMLTPSVVLIPRRALRSAIILQSLAVAQIVCCGVEPPRQSAHGDINCVILPPPLDVAAEAQSVVRLITRAATAGRTTALVGDEPCRELARLATALLEMLEGLSPFDAELRVAHVAGAVATAA